MVDMSLWDTRRQADRALTEGLEPFARLLNEVFSVLDDCVDRLERLDEPFGHVCALVLIKTRNLGLGCYSLCLDALAQEAEALFRPLLEGLELLVYFRLDPTRINEALEKRLPQAGVIAQRIEGEFKDLRDYLNAHASHLSVAPEAMMHLIDFGAGRLRLVQPYNEGVLRRKLGTLLAVLVWLSIEAVNCVSVGEGSVDNDLDKRVEEFERRTLVLLDQSTP
jgi:hypothetical protein